MLVWLSGRCLIAGDGEVECMDVVEELAAALDASNNSGSNSSSSSGSGGGNGSSPLLASALGRSQFTSAADCKCPFILQGLLVSDISK